MSASRTISAQASATPSTTADIAPTAKQPSIWAKLLDESSQSFYYWNTQDDSTVWDRPLDYISDNEGAPIQAPDVSNDAYFQSDAYKKWYYEDYYPSLYASGTLNPKEGEAYESQMYFNNKTSKFSGLHQDRMDRAHHTQEQAAKRQMGHYFNGEKYNEERTAQKQQGMSQGVEGKRRKADKGNKKELEVYKRKAKDAKKKKEEQKWNLPE